MIVDSSLDRYQLHEQDTGSTSYQCALLSNRISELTEHLKIHPKDFPSRRGLLCLVSRRKKFLAALKESDKERYQLIVQNFGLRSK